MTTNHSIWPTENIGGTQQNAEHPTAPVVSVPTNTRSAPRPTAPTDPPYEDTNSTKDKSEYEATLTRPMTSYRPLTGPMISYCPPWPPPPRKCWYSTNVDPNLRRSQPTYYTNTQYYQRNTTKYGVDLSTSNTADNRYPVPATSTHSS